MFLILHIFNLLRVNGLIVKPTLRLALLTH